VDSLRNLEKSTENFYKTPTSESQLRRLTVPYKQKKLNDKSHTDIKKKFNQTGSTFNRNRQQSLQVGNLSSRKNIEMNLKGKSPFAFKRTGLGSSLKKTSFTRDMLKPKNNRKLELGINTLEAKYGLGNNRPMSQNVKSFNSKRFQSKYLWGVYIFFFYE
jgi:hypothetical protein